MSYQNPPTTPRKSWTFDDYTLSEIRRAAATGIYDIRGGGAKRKVPHFVPGHWVVEQDREGAAAVISRRGWTEENHLAV